MNDRKPEEPLPFGSDLPFVSVVIPTHGRPASLEHCLRSLQGQSYPRDRYEIIVVEDRPFDGVVRRILDGLECASQVSIRHEISESIGPAAARNRGWRQAKGEIVAFTDDDVIVSRDWLVEGVKPFNDGVVGVAGHTEVPLGSPPTDYQRSVGRLAYCRFITCNVFYRKHGLERVGGFDERFKRAYREDTDLVFALRKAGCRLVECDSAIVVHPPRPAPWLSSVREQSKQMYDALLYKKHPEQFRKSIKSHPPWNYYAISLSYLFLPIALVLGIWPGAIALAALIVVLEARFLSLRLRGASKAPRHLLEMLISSLLIPPVAVFWRLRGARRFRVPFF